MITTDEKRMPVIDVSILPEWQRQYVWAELQAWCNGNEVSDIMIYKKAYEGQFIFFRDKMMDIFRDKIEKITVISTHTSKSIKLPVYHLVLKNGMSFICKNDFYDWKVSVNSKYPLILPTSLFSDNGQKDVHSADCVGFEKEWVYKSYSNNCCQFTVEIYDDYKLWTFMYLINEIIDNTKI